MKRHVDFENANTEEASVENPVSPESNAPIQPIETPTKGKGKAKAAPRRPELPIKKNGEVRIYFQYI